MAVTTVGEKIYEIDKRLKNVERKPRKRLEFSKVGLLITYVCVMSIVAVCAVLAFQQGDSATFIGVIGGAAMASLATYITFFISKSKAENTKGGVVYDLAMQNQNETEEEE